MKTQLFLVCCAALALGSGCATYDSGGTADDTVVVTGSGYQAYYYDNPFYYADPHRGYFGTGAAIPIWKQPNPNGTGWVDPRPEFLWYR